MVSSLHQDVYGGEYFSLCSQDLAKLIDKLKPRGFPPLAHGAQVAASDTVIQVGDVAVVVVVAVVGCCCCCCCCFEVVAVVIAASYLLFELVMLLPLLLLLLLLLLLMS
jgi:hypothetical protein